MKREAVALTAGVVFAAKATTDAGPLGILVGLGLLACSLAPGDALRASVAARRGFLFGLGTNLVALRFVPQVVVRFTPLPAAAAWLALVLLAAAQALPWALGTTASAVARRRLGAPAFLAFGAGVWLTGMLPSVFPWTPAGGLAPWPVLVQAADVVGERGVAMLAAMAVALCAHAVQERRAAPAFCGAALLGVLATTGALRMRNIDGARAQAPRAKVALLQPGFDAFARWDERRAAQMMVRLTALTKGAEARGVDLTVWPESAYPYTLAHATRRSPGGSRSVLGEGVRGPVLTGAYLSGAKGLGYNSAFLATSDGALSEPYDKRHLLWFGETVPMASTFPWLQEVFARGTGLLAGDQARVFHAGAMRFAVLNCYEDTLASAGREAMEPGPNLLVNITNDAWFAGSGEGELHLMIARLRAVETRRDLVRAVNLGPTSHVDATGRVVARYDELLPGALDTQPALLDMPPTLFVRFGDAPVGVALTAALLAARRRRLRTPAG